MVKVDWIGGMAFESTPPSGKKIVLDAPVEVGGEGKGPTPTEALLTAAAACSAMDVISILRKKKQAVTSYRVEIDGERTAEGVHPRPFCSIVLRHVVEGENLDPAAVQRAVELSDGKYCIVIATLRGAPTVRSEWTIEGA